MYSSGSVFSEYAADPPQPNHKPNTKVIEDERVNEISHKIILYDDY